MWSSFYNRFFLCCIKLRAFRRAGRKRALTHPLLKSWLRLRLKTYCNVTKVFNSFATNWLSRNVLRMPTSTLCPSSSGGYTTGLSILELLVMVARERLLLRHVGHSLKVLLPSKHECHIFFRQCRRRRMWWRKFSNETTSLKFIFKLKYDVYRMQTSVISSKFPWPWKTETLYNFYGFV